MSTSANYALQSPGSGAQRAWSNFVGDTVAGAMATARFLVTVVGSVTLLTAGILLATPGLRDRLFQAVPVMSVSWATPVATEIEPSATKPDLSGRVAAPQPGLVDPRQIYATQYLSRRYRVAAGAIEPLVAAAFESGRELNLDPLLILSVMAIESSMNPYAESPVGAQGLMQVMTRVHTEKFEEHGGDHKALDPIANIKVGSMILKDLIRRGGSVERGLQLYVGAGNLEYDGGYSARVLGEHGRLRLATTGKVNAAIAAGFRAAAQADVPAAPAASPAAREVAAPPASDAKGQVKKST